MTTWFIVLFFWTQDGRLQQQVSNPLPTREACEQMLPRDLAERRSVFGNATGICMSAPPQPAGAADPKPKRATPTT